MSITERNAGLIESLREHFGAKLRRVVEHVGEVTAEVAVVDWLEVCRTLRDHEDFKFQQMIDLCGVDYLGYRDEEWDVTHGGSFSRAVEGAAAGRFDWKNRPLDSVEERFAVVVQLLSITHNQRLRVRCVISDESVPVVPSLIDVWSCANWYEREAFDLFGVLFEGHPDLRRILTDYGFVGHPMRKDFPLIGTVEVRYDEDKGRVIYEPVSIEPRVLVPRVRRDQGQAADTQAQEQSDG